MISTDTSSPSSNTFSQESLAHTRVRGRFAPSPTGYVHIGGLRTALYNYLFVKKHGGDVLLRIEDTDRNRFVEGAAESMVKVMLDIGIVHDEGPFLKDAVTDTTHVTQSKQYPNIVYKGDFGPYAQSDRLHLYQKYAQELVDNGKAYYCFCSPERLDAMRKEQMAQKQMPKYDRFCYTLSAQEIEMKKKQHLEEGAHQVIRFKLPDDATVTIDDLIRKTVTFRTNSMSDAVLLKSDGYPTYHLAMAVDDHLMRISHVIRTEEWLPSLPLHVLLYQALGWDAPQFAHLPLILNQNKSKLSKRQGDVAVEDYLKKGYLKEALINFIALLGWNPGNGNTQELFSLEDLSEQFSFEQVHKAGAVFDVKKLDWLNAQYIKKLSLEELYDKTLSYWKAKDFFVKAHALRQEKEYILRVLQIEQERLVRLSDVGEQNTYFFSDEIPYDTSLLHWKNNTSEQTQEALKHALSVLEALDEKNYTLETLTKVFFEAAGEKRGDFLWPLRVALTGQKQSPPPFEVSFVLGKHKSIQRITIALQKLTGESSL